MHRLCQNPLQAGEWRAIRGLGGPICVCMYMQEPDMAHAQSLLSYILVTAGPSRSMTTACSGSTPWTRDRGPAGPGSASTLVCQNTPCGGGRCAAGQVSWWGRAQSSVLPSVCTGKTCKMTCDFLGYTSEGRSERTGVAPLGAGSTHPSLHADDPRPGGSGGGTSARPMR